MNKSLDIKSMMLLRFRKLTKGLTIAVILSLATSGLSAQLTGTKSIPGDYTTISAAVNALNTSGVGTGGVIFNIAAGYTETIAVTISLTASGTAANPIIFQKDLSVAGANPLITAFTGGTATPVSSEQNGIWRLSGSDYVTINGIDIRDNPANITNPSTMEYGYALYKANSSNGCQFVTIQNCTITLSNINNATPQNPMTDGSAGIIVMNAGALTANQVYGTVAGGSNSNNKFYGNTIQNCNYGICMIGALAVPPYNIADVNNDIGGNSSATGNTIINFGGAPGALNPSAAIRTSGQYGSNISFNTINNNNGAGTNHPAVIRGIFTGAAATASTKITNNTITLKGGGTITNVLAIDNGSGSTAAGNTVNISNNTIINGTYSTATSGAFYGIYNTATPAILTINNNAVLNNLSGATGNGAFYCIYNNGAATGVTINNNNLSGNSIGVSSGSFIGVYNSTPVANLKINSNTLTGNSSASTNSLYYSIFNSGAVTTSIKIDSNNIGNSTMGAITFNAIHGGSLLFINNTAGASGASLSISNNNIQGINYTVQGTSSNTYISNSAATLSQAINNNTFTGLNVNTSGNVTFIANSVIVPSNGIQNVNGNSVVTSFNKGAPGGKVTLFTSTAISAVGSISNNNYNNFSNLTVTGATIIDGWVNTDTGYSAKTIQGNTFSNWTAGSSAVNGMNVNHSGTNAAITGNVISNISGGANVTGIGTAFGNDNIYSNTINALSTTGASTVTGILVTSGTNKNVYSNKIYDLTLNNAGGNVAGISVTGLTIATVNIYNNLVGNLYAPIATTSVDVIRGISVTATAINSTINVFYNTVHLNGTPTGTNFSSSGIFHTTSPTATTAKLNLRNNIISNLIIPTGTGISAAYRRSTAALDNYGATSDNNLFYAGTPGASRLIFFDGTGDQTLPAFKLRVSSRDAHSVSEDLATGAKFLSTSGASASFLHLDPAQSTQAESGGVNIANFTTDYDGAIRQGNAGYTGASSAPDIGADEINGSRAIGLSGVYYVGAGQQFTSLTNAGGLFAGINSVGLSGNVVVNITSNLAEDGGNALYQWAEQGTGNYTLTIQPDIASARIISGNVVTGMIRLNGAKRVTFDGGGSTLNNYLTFRNTNTAGVSGTAFTLLNGASFNTIKYCNAEAYTNATNGVILFSTSTIAGGNSNNTLSNCNVNATVAGSSGSVGIYSAGTTGYENANNTISNTNIFNYRDKGLDIAATGSKNWEISNNSFYNGDVTSSVNYAASFILYGIRVAGGGGYSILNNYIGGNAPLGGGTNASYASTSGNLAFYGIQVTAGTGTCNIKGNIIRRVTVSSVPTASSSNAFTGIEAIGAGVINIGGISPGEGNMVGSNTLNSSIIVNTNTSAAGNFSYIRGINYTGTNISGTISGNQVAGIDINNIASIDTLAAPSFFQGIHINTATAPLQINNNIIGSTGTGAAANSIRVIAASNAKGTTLYGIYLSGAVTSTSQVNANIIQNVSHQVSLVSTGTFYGIWIGAVAGANITVTNNIVKGNSVSPTAGLLYGIFNNASASSITINSDTIINNTSNATTGLLYGVYLQGSPVAVSINNNTFANNTVGVLNATPGFVGFYNGAAAATLTINNNAYYNNVTSTVGGATYFIRNTGIVTGSININNNSFGTPSLNAITFNGVSNSNLFFIDNIAGTAAATLSISNNTFRGINYAVGGTGGNIYINNTAATLTQTINGNTFIDLDVNTAGNLTFISNSVIVPATGIQNVNNNSISGTFKKAAGNTITFFTSSATSTTGAVINNNYNNFSNITLAGATNISGWVNGDIGGSTKNIQNNIFSNWTGGTGGITAMSVNSGANSSISGNLINNVSVAGSITGITTAAGTDNIFLNRISTLTTPSGAVTGIAVTAGTAKNIYKNKISDLQSGSGTVNGISVSGGTAVNIHNNLIGHLRTPAANNNDAVRGISITSIVAPSTINVYYNTIYINATSSGTNFGSTGIYHVTSATATTALLNLRNNSITNTSTAKGTGFTVCYRLSNATYTNYAASSNNNLFYAGVPAATNLIFYDGTPGDQTLGAYITRMATRDALSVTEDITLKFLSLSGSSAVYLHMDSTFASAIKNGAANIAGYTEDFDGQVRFGNAGYSGFSTAPSIGADEIFGIESLPPVITYTPLTNTTSTANRNVTGVSITDASGVNIYPGTKPRIYFKRISDANVWLDNSPNTNGWKFTEATNSTSPFTFVIDYALLYGGATVTAGLIQYFIAAQDIATTANITANSGTFAAAPSSVALTAAAFPAGGAINSYNIAFSGIYNVGASEVFTSLTKADGLFASINNAGMMGNTTFKITSDLVEDGANALNQWTESGVGNYTLTIQPDAAIVRTISGNAAAGLIRFNGADRVKIDGSSAGSGTYLIFKNTNNEVTTGSAISFINGASNNIIRFTGAQASTNASTGVVFFGTSAIPGGNSNNLVTNCTINATPGSNIGKTGLYSGGTVGNENSSNTISNNIISDYSDRGMDISASGSSNWTISGNSFYNGLVTAGLNYAASSTLSGIRVLGGTGYSILNNNIGGDAMLASGANAVYSSTTGNLLFQGIVLSTSGATPASYITGNTIGAVSIYSSPAAPNSVVFTGIETSGSGINIGGSLPGEGNTIGANTANGSITITTSSALIINTTLIKGISCASAGGIIKGNQVGGLDINNIGAVPSSSAFEGIYVNIATSPQVDNNIIGSSLTSNSIRIMPTSTATATSITGIATGVLVNSATSISSNRIENITNQSSVSSGAFTGISYKAAVTAPLITISNNIIQNINTAANTNAGSTVYRGIISASASVISNNIISNIVLVASGTNAQVTGISVSGPFVQTISGNTINGLSTGSSRVSSAVETGSPAQSAIIGILNAATVSGQSISGNLLADFSALNPAPINTLITGIAITGSSSGNIFRNRLTGFINAATGINPGILGIIAFNGNFNAYNNSIKLDNPGHPNGVNIYGINHAAGSSWNYYYNTISIGGNAGGVSARSAAFIRPVAASMILRNNIFLNIRTGNGLHYAISNLVAPPASAWLPAASDYNELYSSNLNTTGEWGNGINRNFIEWQASTDGDSHSVSHLVNFIPTPYDLQPDSTTNCSLDNAGITISSPVNITTDLINVIRNVLSPDLGAYEFTHAAFTVSAGNNSPVCAGSTVNLNSDPGTAANPSYSWTDSAFTNVSTSQNPGIIAIGGPYTVTISDPFGCSDSATSVVIINSRPTAVISGTASICSGNSTVISINVTGSGTINGSLSNGEIFSGTAPLIQLTEAPLLTTNYTIVTLSDNSCTAQAVDLTSTARVTVVSGSLWTGTAGNNWNDVANWCGIVPTNASDATIPAGMVNYPYINSVADVRAIDIDPAASLSISGAGTLSISGNFSNQGTLANLGKIILKGSLPQNFPGSSATISSMNNLEVNNAAGVTIDQSFGLTGTLTSTAGLIDLADMSVTLHSGMNNTANVAAVNGGFQYSGGGKFVIERYIPARRAWRLMTVPLTNTNTIYDAWQNVGTYTPGIGTLVSGPGGGNGLDLAGTSSLKEYSVASQSLFPVTNTYVNISPGNNGSADNKGYFIFIRGDRDPANFNTANKNTTTLVSIGRLQTGPQTFNAGATAGNFTLIGNPYASPINFTNISRTNVINRFYVWDPRLNLVGGYVMMDDFDNTGTYSKSVAGSGQTEIVQSEQAFFVVTIATGTASITINESDKVGLNNNLVFRPMLKNSQFSTELFLLNADSSTILADGALAEFNVNFSDKVTREDALKMSNVHEELAMVRYGNRLTLERRPAFTGNDTLYLKLTKTSRRAYRFKFTADGISHPGLVAFLIDKFDSSVSPINVSGTTEVSFTVSSDKASVADDRFMIVFKPSLPLPVTFSSVKAYHRNANIAVAWKVENELNILNYEVERSGDGKVFMKVNSTVATGNNNSSVQYNWVDEHGKPGYNYYRIRSNGLDGKPGYSEIVKINIENKANLIVVYPNPIINNVINLHFTHQLAGSYKARLVNSLGQLVYMENISLNNGTTNFLIKVPQVIANGLYHLELIGMATTQVLPVMVE